MAQPLEKKRNITCYLMHNLMRVTSTGESLTSFTTRMPYFNVAAVSFFQFILACHHVASIKTLICMKVEREKRVSCQPV